MSLYDRPHGKIQTYAERQAAEKRFMEQTREPGCVVCGVEIHQGELCEKHYNTDPHEQKNYPDPGETG